ncbi:hypothetical protein Tco_1040189 [Tanacetum coccineum]
MPPVRLEPTAFPPVVRTSLPLTQKFKWLKSLMRCLKGSEPSSEGMIRLSRVSRWIKIQLQPIFFWEKGDPAPLPPWRAHTDHMRASEKELVVLKSPSEQKLMFRRQEIMLRRQEQQRLAKDAKIQRSIWDPEIKSIQDNTLRARWF